MRNTLMATAAPLWDVRVDVARQVLECLQVREALECRAVGRAALAPVRDLGEAHTLAARLDSVTSVDEWHALDVQFHRAVHDVGGNEVLADYAERLHREALELRGASLHAFPTRVGAWMADHRQLLAAIEAGDVVAAPAIARRHVQGLLAALLPEQP
jgi:GntR family transcriptional repressor for pyruvate dehydrogenase complex